MLMLGPGALGPSPADSGPGLSVISITGCDEIVSDPPQGLPLWAPARDAAGSPDRQRPGSTTTYRSAYEKSRPAASSCTPPPPRSDWSVATVSSSCRGPLGNLPTCGLTARTITYSAQPLALRLVSCVSRPPREGPTPADRRHRPKPAIRRRADELNRLGKDLWRPRPDGGGDRRLCRVG